MTQKWQKLPIENQCNVIQGSYSPFLYILERRCDMNYHDIRPCDLVNGEGVRCVLWVSGCIHRCNGCFNEQTWNPNSGVEFNDKARKEIFEALSNPYCSGLTLSGGDPFHPNNFTTLIRLCEEVKILFPTKSIWIYSGFTYEFLIEDVKRKELLRLTDVLIDGKFELDKASKKANYRGSSNQRIIDVQQSIAKGKVVLHSLNNEMERRI